MQMLRGSSFYRKWNWRKYHGIGEPKLAAIHFAEVDPAEDIQEEQTADARKPVVVEEGSSAHHNIDRTQVFNKTETHMDSTVSIQ